MAMLSARFEDSDAARRVMDVFITDMGATPNLVIASPEGARPGNATDAGTEPHHPTAMPPVEAVRVAIHDNAIDAAAARAAFEAAGGVDIRPIQ
ncbi:hypothetical protein GCM10007973_13600 [Polymorphobacter multimanifer]|uniref:Uncharacterized protein n=1 Tax=Polymorphobacter multimanifer TaxID=1070431 RepID=A0A841L657_9SPHN|nr:hypothetical protein [Polymorphobacter multimanifer]MBB6227011.1 hypothetical protein [Polymorphobacter multimanifer]GGI78155.1 hypothetical protein GCM10007973_13600 [Polymorphobacter multimanifer]